MLYNVISKYSKKKGIIIKVETNKLKRRIKNKTQVISGFGEFFPCICTDESILFADKIDALTKKYRGRHIYDIIFMLSNKYLIDRNFFKGFGIKKEPLEVISEAMKRFSKSELERQAESLRPFLFDEQEANLVANAQEIIPSLIEKYK
jgi:predicted nucleotidyltransferase component of viral defense system